MNSYELSRDWWDFCFDNPEKISPNHSAIFFFAIEHCNRLGWRKKFGFPTQMAMDAIGIKKNQTYMRYFNDLVEWGFFVLVERSSNQYSANIISLQSALPKKDKAHGKALDKAIITHAAKQTESMGQSNSPIDKPINQLTNKPINQEPLCESAHEIFQHHEIVEIVNDIFQRDYIPSNLNRMNRELINEMITNHGYTKQKIIDAWKNITKDKNHIDNNFNWIKFGFLADIEKIERFIFWKDEKRIGQSQDKPYVFSKKGLNL